MPKPKIDRTLTIDRILGNLNTNLPGMNINGNYTVPRTDEERKLLHASAVELKRRRRAKRVEDFNNRSEVIKIRDVTHPEEEKDRYEGYEKPSVIGMSGYDPLLGMWPETVATFGGAGTLFKTGLWNLAKRVPTSQLGNYGRLYFVGNAFKNSFNGTVPALTSQTTSLLYLPVKLNESGLTSLKFFERKPARINEAEKVGVPKGDRNNKKIINPDNVYGNLRFIRNIDGFPTIKDGLVQLGNSDKLLTNFTTDLPFRLHDWYPNIPGSTYMVVSPRAFKGKKFYSIKPSDSFLSTVDSKVTPNQVRIISGDPKILAEAERRGMRTLTSDKLQDLFNVGSEITKKEFELGRNGAIRPFANADVAINDFKFRNRFYGEDVPEILSKYPEGVVTPYRAEVDKLITQNIGRPSAKDYLILENMTGLDAGIINKFDSELIKKAKDPLATRDMFEKVYYPVTSQIEEKLMNSIGLYPGPYYSFSNLLKLDKLKGNPIKKKQGGKMNILEFLKNGSGIHIKKKKSGIKIKPSHKGLFTDYCGGKVTSECIAKGKNSSNPAIRKRATFALNSRRWSKKHRTGGLIVLKFKQNKDLKFTNARKWKHQDGGKMIKKAEEGAKFNTGLFLLNTAGLLYNGIKNANNSIKFNESLDAGVKSIKSNINMDEIKRKSEEVLNNWRELNPDVHYSDIDLALIQLKFINDLMLSNELEAQKWRALLLAKYNNSMNAIKGDKGFNLENVFDTLSPLLSKYLNNTTSTTETTV